MPPVAAGCHVSFVCLACDGCRFWIRELGWLLTSVVILCGSRGRATSLLQLVPTTTQASVYPQCESLEQPLAFSSRTKRLWGDLEVVAISQSLVGM